MHKLRWKCRNEANGEKIIMQLLLSGRIAFSLFFSTVRIFKKAISIWMFPNQLCIWASSWLLFHTLCLRSRCRFIKLDRKRFPCIFHYGSRFFFHLQNHFHMMLSLWPFALPYHILVCVCVCVGNSLNEEKKWSRTIPLVQFKAVLLMVLAFETNAGKSNTTKDAVEHFFAVNFRTLFFSIIKFSNSSEPTTRSTHMVWDWILHVAPDLTISPTGSILCCISPMLSWRVCSTVITSI